MAEKLMEDLDQILEQLSPEEQEKFFRSIRQMLVEMEIRERVMMQRVDEAVFGKDIDFKKEDEK